MSAIVSMLNNNLSMSASGGGLLPLGVTFANCDALSVSEISSRFTYAGDDHGGPPTILMPDASRLLGCFRFKHYGMESI